MSGTCIVCLGDLGDGFSDSLGVSTPSAKSPPHDNDGDPVTTPTNPESANEDTNQTELIAHLKPCGHNLHNDCLTPWVERANSCPICRARFYTVELSRKVGGTKWHSFLTLRMKLTGSLQEMSLLRTPSRIDPKLQTSTLQCSWKRWKILMIQSHAKYVRKTITRMF
jgi:Ring finger domain